MRVISVKRPHVFADLAFFVQRDVLLLHFGKADRLAESELVSTTAADAAIAAGLPIPGREPSANGSLGDGEQLVEDVAADRGFAPWRGEILSSPDRFEPMLPWPPQASALATGKALCAAVRRR